MLLNKTPAWQALERHKNDLAGVLLNDLFESDPLRFKNLSVQIPGLLIDYSKQRVTTETIKLLCNLAELAGLKQAIEKLFNGDIVNFTEQRPALHTELRNPQPNKRVVTEVLQQMRAFINQVHSSHYTDVIILGIGGSDLGPRLVYEALEPYRVSSIRLHFVANVDGDTLMPLLKKLNNKNTLCIINSKTFTTIETLANAKIIKRWLVDNNQNLIAVTTNKKLAEDFGVSSAQIFEFWDWVGGRYSVWSAVGLSVALSIGMDNFELFLNGANAMDIHFRKTPLEKNIPVLMALIGIWNINFNNYLTLAIKPYADGLQLLPAYLQQLEMESNGKSASNSGENVDYHTAPIIWGGVGCNGQHAYMQLLHQGTQIVPVDFLVAKQSVNGNADLQSLLLASCLGQSQALMTGRMHKESYKTCPGNKPSTTLVIDKLTPEALGSIIALYEHKVFVQGIIWQIQSFDQWGVQLGKELIKDVLDLMRTKNLQNIDSSTAGLLNHLLADNSVDIT